MKLILIFIKIFLLKKEEEELQSIPILENLKDYDNDIITPKTQSFKKVKSKRIPLNSFRTIEEKFK